MIWCGKLVAFLHLCFHFMTTFFPYLEEALKMSEDNQLPVLKIEPGLFINLVL